jgi:uncharacterized protein (DUF1501 family)
MKRKDFIKYMTGGALALPSTLQAFANSQDTLSQFSEIANIIDTDRVLIIIRLEGGNDGLNTIIPLNQYANYFAARTDVAIPEDKVLKPKGVTEWGFHPALESFKQLFEDKKLSVVHSVGYPKQDFSHFRSSDIWASGADYNEILNTGWVGRYLKYEYPNFPNGFPNAAMPDPLSIEIGNSMPLLLQGPLNGMGVSAPGNVTTASQFFEKLLTIQTPAPNNQAGEQLKYVRFISGQSRLYNQTMKKAFDKTTETTVAYPTTDLGIDLANQLKTVARLIAGGLKTRVYVVSIGTFDSHDNQVAGDKTQGKHAKLLQYLGGSVAAFMKDIEIRKLSQRVMGMTFSEFGRRIKSNGSKGTDHGAAAPVFLFGHHVSSGTLGNLPTIPKNLTAEDNIPMQYDFRSIYATILKDWFCVPSSDVETILLKKYQFLPLISAPGCIPTAVHEQNQQAGVSLLNIYPNPFEQIVNINFETQEGHASIQIFNTMGQLIATPAQGYFNEGQHSIYWNSENLSAGTYYCRLQTGASSQVLPMIKVR